jgi:conjugal transfer/type IV secretion protein DotA/TraY
MIGLTQLGSFLINVSAVTAGVLGAAGAVPIAGNGVMTLSNIIGPILVMIAGGGAALAYIIPMLPFLFWVLAVTGYFLLVVEAVVAASLWAVAHLKMDGEGISGDSARQGYLMILALLMTPVLMVFGYIVGMTIFRVTSGIIDIGFYYALAGLDGGPLTWLVGTAAVAVLIVISYIIMIERSFSLVSELPSRVLAWIGTRAEVTRGEEARMQGAAVAAGAGAGVITRSVGASAGAVSGRAASAIANSRNRIENGGTSGQKNSSISGPGDTGGASRS